MPLAEVRAANGLTTVGLIEDWALGDALAAIYYVIIAISASVGRAKDNRHRPHPQQFTAMVHQLANVPFPAF